MPNYFVSYMGWTKDGSPVLGMANIKAGGPITCMDDVLSIRTQLAETEEPVLDPKDVTIINWRKYDDE